MRIGDAKKLGEYRLLNYTTFKLPSLSVNEGMARAAVAALADF